jgi:excisionase family DNA binding protein
MNTEEYFRPPEAATYLRTSTSTLAKLRCAGGGPYFVRIGRAIRYKKSDLEDFMAKSKVSSTTEGVTHECT